MRAICIAVLLLSGACAATGSAQTPASPPQAAAEAPCQRPEFAALDFWIGEWDVSWEGGQGVNRISKTFDGCVIEEHFEGGPSTNNLVGASFSTFQAPLGQWRQTWVDNQGGYFALVGGPVGDDFILTNTRLREDAPHLRMVFENITHDSLTWRWQRSSDGAAWSDAWVIQYRRRAAH